MLVGGGQNFGDDGRRLSDPVQLRPHLPSNSGCCRGGGGGLGVSLSLLLGAVGSWLGGVGRSRSSSSGGGTGVVVQVVLQGGLVGLTRLLVLKQHLLDPDLLQDGRELVVVEEVDHGMLRKRKKKKNEKLEVTLI